MPVDYSADAIARRLGANPYAPVDPGSSSFTGSGLSIPSPLSFGSAPMYPYSPSNTGPGAPVPSVSGYGTPGAPVPSVSGYGTGIPTANNPTGAYPTGPLTQAQQDSQSVLNQASNGQVFPLDITNGPPTGLDPTGAASTTPTPSNYAGDPSLLNIGISGAQGPGITDPSQYGTPNADLAMTTLQQMLDPMSYAKLATSITYDPQIMGVQNQMNLARTQADIQNRDIQQTLSGGQQAAQLFQGLGSKDMANAYAQLQQELAQQTGQTQGAYNSALNGVANAYNGAQNNVGQSVQNALMGLQGNAQRLGQTNALTDPNQLILNELSRYGAQNQNNAAQSIGNLATLGAQQVQGAGQAQTQASQQLAQRQSDMAQSMLNNVMNLQTQAGQASRGVQEQLSQQVQGLAGQLAGLDAQKSQSLLKSYQDVIGSRYELERQANLDDLARQISLGTLAIQQGQLGVAQGTLGVNQYLAPAKADYYSGRGYQGAQAGALDAAKVADPTTYLNAGTAAAKPPQGAYGFQQFVGTLDPTTANAAINLLNGSINAAASTAGSNPQQMALAALTNPALAQQMGVNISGANSQALSDAINTYYGTMYK